MFCDWRKVGSVALLVMVVVSATAWAAPGDRLKWAFQETGIRGGQTTALAMTGGLAWPVIFTDWQMGSAYTLVAAGGKAAGGSWQAVGTGLFASQSPYMRADSSTDGRIVVVGGYGTTSGGWVYGSSGSWSSLASGTTMAAFDKGGNLVIGNPQGVLGLPGISGPGLPSMAISDMGISPTGDVGVIDSRGSINVNDTGRGNYRQYSPWVGRWLSTSIQFPSADLSEPWISLVDVEFDSRSRPHILAMESSPIFGRGSRIYAADFSTITGTWQTTVLPTSVAVSQMHPALAANSKGEIATAWVGDTGNLMFSYKPDNGDWITSVVASDASRSQRQLGLMYDHADYPVISYIGNDGYVRLAYDAVGVPVGGAVGVPEPGAVGLVVLAGLVAMGRNGLRGRRSRD